MTTTVPQPQFQSECLVTVFGAVGDNKTEDTAAVQAALDNCTVVIFPSPGKFLLRPVHFRHSNMHVVVEAGATVVAWPDVDTWNTSSAVRPLFSQDTIAIHQLSNFSLTGGGIIDGQGWRWWPFLKTRSRPILLNIDLVAGLLISNITFRDSPSFHVQVRGVDMEIAHSRVEANLDSCDGWEKAPNTDAFNIGGHRIHLHDLWVHNGDDCIPTNPMAYGSPAAGEDGTTSGVLVENVHCECGTNGGVLIVPGSRGIPPLDWRAGGPNWHPRSIHNVTYRNMTVAHTNQGAGFKISEAYENVTGGMVSDVTWEDIQIINPRNVPIYINVYTEDAAAAQCRPPSDAARPGWLTARDLTFRNIVATVSQGAFPGCFLCSPTEPCTGLVFDNVTVSGGGKFLCYNAHGSQKSSSPSPCFVQ